MSIAMLYQTYISDPSDYAIYADARIGDNGDIYGTPEYEVGTPDTSIASYRTWDSTPSNGIDSGWVNVELHLHPGGGSNGVEWSVNGGVDGPLEFSDASYGTISQVQVTAGVQKAGVSIQWDSLVATFFKNGSQTQAITVPSNQTPQATGTSGTPVNEEITTITPTASDNTELVLTGRISMHANQGVSVSANDIFSEVLVAAT